jgi:ABC-type multidrug transport system fused ATPase/permease subunit
MPFLAVLADPGRIQSTPVLAWAYTWSGLSSKHAFLAALGGASFIVIVLASAIQIVRTWVVARYTMMRSHSISHRLLASYLGQPYPFFLDRHSGDMSSLVLVEASQVVARCLKPLAECIASILTIFALVGLLLWVDPMVAVAVFGLLGGVYLVIFKFTRQKLNRLGEVRINANRGRYRVVNEALTGIKDIKLIGRERAYLDRFAKPSTRMALNEVSIEVLSQVPPLAFQAFGLGGGLLLCVILVGSGNGNDIDSILPILGVFAFAGQRIMPEMSKLYTALAQLQTGRASVAAVHADLIERRGVRYPAPAPEKGLGLNHSLIMENVSYTYPNASRPSLNAISLTIRAGEKIGIVGTTGAGKTTLADLILGLLAPDEGRVLVDDLPIDLSNQREWRRSVGYVPQDIFLIDASVAENIALGIDPADIKTDRLQEAARIARIDRFIRDELAEGFDTHVGERGIRLSGGQRQRIGIARALYHDADLILFDEATSALDNLTEQEVMDAIDALPGDKTVLMIAHRLSTVRRCDHIIVLERGKLVGFGDWNTLMSSNQIFQRIARLAEAA